MQKQLAYLFFFLLLSLSTAQAQQPGLGQLGQGTDNAQPDTTSELTLDTSDLYSLYAFNPEQEFDYPDTLLGTYFTQYDPIRQADPDLGHLGNVGTAHQQLVFHPRYQRGLSLGMTQFDLYRNYAQDLLFYRTEQAYTLAHFSQGPSQDDLQFGVEFAREFANQTSFSINYQRLNNLGAYTHQKAVNDALAFGFRYYTPSERYEFFLTFANNTHTQEENGGITNLPVELADPLTIPVNLETAETRFATRQYRLDQHYKIRRDKDSLRQDKRALVLSHSFEYRSDSYKFYDDALAADSAFYGVLQTDSRGLRHFVSVNSLSNQLRLRTYRHWPVDSTGVKRTRDLLELGLSHTAHSLDQEPEESTIQNLFLTGRWKFSPFKGLSLDTKGHYGLAANGGDYRVEARLKLDLKKLGRFEAGFLNQLNTPDQIAQRLFISQDLFWENDFKKTFTTSLEATYEIPDWNFAVSGRYHLLNNFLYYDQEGIARQTGIPISIPQLLVKANFRVWKLHLDNEVVLQQATETEIRVPNLYSNHSFYFYGTLFKRAMLAKFGFDLRLSSDYQPNTYQPLTGRFHLQDEYSTGWQPIIDGFVSFKVEKFRFFFRYENALPLLTEQYYYLTAGYPIVHGQFRVGLAWQFVD